MDNNTDASRTLRQDETQYAIPWPSLKEAQNCIIFAFYGRDKMDELENTGINRINKSGGRPDWNSEGAKDFSIVDHIAKFRDWKVTNPLDRIYAFRGLPSREDMSDFQVNYELSEENLLETFANWHVFKTRTLDILAYACPTEYTVVDGQVKLRTKWVPDWENICNVEPLTWLPAPSKNPIYHTSGDTKVDDFLLTISGNAVRPTLPWFGFEIDQVKEVGDVLLPGSEDPYHPHSPLMQQWESIMNNLYLQRNPYTVKGIDTSDFQYYTVSDFGTNVALQTFSLPSNIEPEQLALIEAYWRTLIGDRWDVDPHIPTESVPRYRADRSIWRYWADWHDGIRQPDNGFLMFRTRLSALATNRRFMLTENNYMGLAPELTKVGDRICVFLGGQTPYIVRKSEEEQRHHASMSQDFSTEHFIGDAYVHGMMDGEAMEKYSNGEQTKKLFLLV